MWRARSPLISPAEHQPRKRRSPALCWWTNTNSDTTGITHFSFESDGGRYCIRAFGAGHPDEWGCVEVIPHVHSVMDTHGIALMARYDFGFAEVTLAANENKGLMIIARITASATGAPDRAITNANFSTGRGGVTVTAPEPRGVAAPARAGSPGNKALAVPLEPLPSGHAVSSHQTNRGNIRRASL